MEATPGQDEMNKVQITDLKGELAKSEETLKFRTEELLQVKKELRHSDPKFKNSIRKVNHFRSQNIFMNLVILTKISLGQFCR